MWTVASQEFRGEADDDGKDVKVLFENGMLLLRTKEGVELGTYGLDPTNKPKAIDFMPLSGPNKGKTLFGIYAVEGEKGDTLKICLDMNAEERPKEFKTTPGSNYELLVLK